MIGTFIMTIGGNLYLVLIGLLPSGSLPTGITTGLTTVISYMYKFNALLPIDTLFQVLTATLIFEGAFLLFDLMQWVLRKIPLLNIK